MTTKQSKKYHFAIRNKKTKMQEAEIQFVHTWAATKENLQKAFLLEFVVNQLNDANTTSFFVDLIENPKNAIDSILKLAEKCVYITDIEENSL